MAELSFGNFGTTFGTFGAPLRSRNWFSLKSADILSIENLINFQNIKTEWKNLPIKSYNKKRKAWYFEKIGIINKNSDDVIKKLMTSAEIFFCHFSFFPIKSYYRGGGAVLHPHPKASFKKPRIGLKSVLVPVVILLIFHTKMYATILILNRWLNWWLWLQRDFNFFLFGGRLVGCQFFLVGWSVVGGFDKRQPHFYFRLIRYDHIIKPTCRILDAISYS